MKEHPIDRANRETREKRLERALATVLAQSKFLANHRKAFPLPEGVVLVSHS